MAGGTDARHVDKWRPWPLLTRRQIETSPSFKLGMGLKAEKRLRDTACKLINDAGRKLDQGMIVIALAQSYFIRFFAVKPYQKNDSFIVALAALFVASKTENKPKALMDIAYISWPFWVKAWVSQQRKKRKDQPASFWAEVQERELRAFKKPEVHERLTKAATLAERVLLYATGFQFNIMTALNATLGSVGILSKNPDPAVSKFFGDEGRYKAACQFCIDDYAMTRHCLEYDPRTIAIASFDLVCRVANQEIPLVNGQDWWRFIANTQSWDVEAIGNPESIAVIQQEIRRFYTLVDPKKDAESGLTNGFHPSADAAERSRPGTPLPARSLTPPPGASPAAQPSQLPGLQPIDGRSAGHAVEPPSANGASHDGQAPPQLSPAAVAQARSRPTAATQNLHVIAAQAPTPQVKQKEAVADVRFSPSDEFAASPAVPDDSAQTSAPLLLGADGAAPLVLGPATVGAGEEDKKKARLASFRAMIAGKRKPSERGPSAEPEAKKPKSPPGGVRGDV